jgi:hypothetical protein
MDDVEVFLLPDDRFEGQDFVGYRILTVRIEAQTPAGKLAPSGRASQNHRLQTK